MRGEYSVEAANHLATEGSPPLAWGIPGKFLSMDGKHRITPTCVGNTGCGGCHRRRHWDHPHLRGEYLAFKVSNEFPLGSPPLAWGIHETRRRQKLSKRITPTCVGNTSIDHFIIYTREDHPHLRGEYPTKSAKKCGKYGITPTCVGNTTRSAHTLSTQEDHPHLRGEYRPFPEQAWLQSGSPPLAWGIQVQARGLEGLSRITPTCVGNTFV